jgi:protein associated with RNAse G/E
LSSSSSSWPPVRSAVCVRAQDNNIYNYICMYRDYGFPKKCNTISPFLQIYLWWCT